MTKKEKKSELDDISNGYNIRFIPPTVEWSIQNRIDEFKMKYAVEPKYLLLSSTWYRYFVLMTKYKGLTILKVNRPNTMSVV